MRMLRRFCRRYHEDLIRLQAWINGIICVLAACCLDGEGYMAEIICGVTLLWLMLYAYANGYFEIANNTFQYEEDNEK